MIRKITYLVTKDTKGITPNTIQWAGMQYEDCATEVIFDLSALDRTQGCNYRIDFNSDGAGYHPSKNLTLKNGKISRTIPKFITQYGGELQITAVVTSIETTEVVYSYPVKVRLTPVDKSQHGNETVEGNLSEMEESVKNMTRRCEDASSDAARFAKSAENDRALTEEARFALEHDSEFVFLGGDASGSVSTELVVDGVMSDTSENPVMNKTIKAYVDRAKDYIVEQGTAVTKADEATDKEKDITWTYRKWNSGIAELWCAVGVKTAFANKVSDGHYHGKAFPSPDYPFELIDTIHPQFSLYYAETSHLDFCLSGYRIDLHVRPPEFVPYMPWLVNEEKSVTGRYYVIGNWK